MIDPMSQNPVPPGALPEEVRDDVPINASEGEYVLSADVVRYIGLDKIQKMEKQAKEGIAEMHQTGRVGGEEPTPPPEMPMSGPMEFNRGGLVERDFDERNIPFAFDPMPYAPEREQQQIVKKFIGPNGRVLYIPLNAAGNPVVPVPSGFRDANEAPVTPEQAIQQTREGDDPMWGDDLTPDQIREQQESWRGGGPTLEFEPQQNTGQLPGFLGDAVAGITDRLRDVFGRLSSGEAFGGLAQVAATLAGQPVLGSVLGSLINQYNEKRKAEGLPEMEPEEIAREVSRQTGVSPAEISNAVREAKTQLEASPPTPESVGQAATQEGAIDTSQYNVIGRSGTPDNPSAMVMTPDGQVISVRVGDEIDGVTVKSINLDPSTPLGDSVTFEGSLPSTTEPSGLSRPQAGLGSRDIGFSAPEYTGRSFRDGVRDAPSPDRGAPSFGADTGRDQAMAEGRTSTGAAVSGPEAQAGFSVGESVTGQAGVGSSFSDAYGPASARSTSAADYSTGRSVGSPAGQSEEDYAGGTRNFNRGGLVKSPYKNYDITSNYKKGGLVKRKK